MGEAGSPPSPVATDVAASLDYLASASRRHPDAAGALNEIVTAASEMSDHDGVALSLIEGSGKARSVAAAGEHAQLIDAAEFACNQGPCLDAMADNAIVGTRDIIADARWPLLAPRIRSTGVKAVLGIPVRVDNAPVGVLNVYRNDSVDWNHSQIEPLLAYSGIIEQLFGTASAARQAGVLSQQLQHALDYRVTIDRAVGYLMATQDLDAATAFNTLRSYSRGNRRKVIDVAHEVLAGRLKLGHGRVGPSAE